MDFLKNKQQLELETFRPRLQQRITTVNSLLLNRKIYLRYQRTLFFRQSAYRHIPFFPVSVQIIIGTYLVLALDQRDIVITLLTACSIQHTAQQSKKKITKLFFALSYRRPSAPVGSFLHTCLSTLERNPIEISNIQASDSKLTPLA